MVERRPLLDIVSHGILLLGVAIVAFPLYLTNVSTLRIGTSFLFVIIVLVWFYALALILLAGAVVNELRFEARPAAEDET